MTRYLFVVNKTKKVFFDEMHNQSDLATDADLWNEFIRHMETDWRGDEIAIMQDWEDGYYENYTTIKVNRE
jgi:hypothetical protein